MSDFEIGSMMALRVALVCDPRFIESAALLRASWTAFTPSLSSPFPESALRRLAPGYGGVAPLTFATSFANPCLASLMVVGVSVEDSFGLAERLAPKASASLLTPSMPPSWVMSAVASALVMLVLGRVSEDLVDLLQPKTMSDRTTRPSAVVREVMVVLLSGRNRDSGSLGRGRPDGNWKDGLCCGVGAVHVELRCGR